MSPTKKKVTKKPVKPGSRVKIPQMTAAEKKAAAKKTKKAAKDDKGEHIAIPPPNILTAQFKIRFNAPYVQNAFSKKALEQMVSTQEQGSTAKKGRKRTAKNFKELYEQSQHVSEKGWNGIPAAAFRNACVSACKICGFAMTRAKLSVFCVADGFDKHSMDPLVKITKGKPRMIKSMVRNSGPARPTDVRARAMFNPGCEATVTLQFDADQFTLDDVTNLLARAGMQVGIGEGRPDSPMSCGMGWGTFDLLNK